MATGKDESELVVTHGSVLFPVVAGARRCAGDRTQLFMQLVGAVPRVRTEPPRRVGWDTVAPPPVACHNERLLDGVFGKRDVAEDAGQRRHRLAVHLTEYALDTGRLPLGGAG